MQVERGEVGAEIMDARIRDNALYVNSQCPQCGNTILHDAVVMVRTPTVLSAVAHRLSLSWLAAVQ
jgi:hypothetical protein